MRHLLMDPAFPDIVGEWAVAEAQRQQERPPANDNDDRKSGDLSDPLLVLFARIAVAAERIW